MMVTSAWTVTHFLDHKSNGLILPYSKRQLQLNTKLCHLWQSFRESSNYNLLCSWANHWSWCSHHIVSVSAFLMQCVGRCEASSDPWWSWCDNNQLKFWISVQSSLLFDNTQPPAPVSYCHSILLQAICCMNQLPVIYLETFDTLYSPLRLHCCQSNDNWTILL
jgi:hypothetical protein